MSDSSRSRALRGWLSTLPAVLILVAVILHGTGEKVHARLLQTGESLWPGYASLRVDPVKPTCDPNAAAAEPAPDEGGDDFLDDLMGEEGTSGAAAAAAKEKCLAAHARYTERLSKITPGLRAFRAFETSIAAFVALGVAYLRHVLVLLFLIAAATATALRGHIALRPPMTTRDDKVSQVGQLVANVLLVVSSFWQWRVDQASGLEVQNAALPLLWTAGFAVMAVLNVFHLLRPSKDLEPGGSTAAALVTVPLYATMAIIAGTYFLLAEGHPTGLAIYLQKLTEHSLIYIQVGLYVWAGMLLKRTRITNLTFALLRPWKMPPEILAFVVVAFAAIPTAYSGASGIFVIAAGAVIFQELRKAGLRRQLALAATAMSGSRGVVLAPCLLVVIVASLNKQVTTDQLYHWGFWVFLLATVLFLVAILFVKKGPVTLASPKEALPGSVAALRSLAPYVLVAAVVLAVYAFGLGTPMDEHTAPVILPVLLLLLLVYDRRAARRELESAPAASLQDGGGVSLADGGAFLNYRRALFDATSETTGHIGALLALMALSISIGGIIERSRVVEMVPSDFGSVWLAMIILVLVLVFIGMIMDPYGAVILVSAAIAEVAYRNGIDPVHFWMVVLVAFELGYLTPPVALNHLLTRQVVGKEAFVHDEADGKGFYRRHERVILPIAVMGTTLVVVAFVPLFFR